MEKLMQHPTRILGDTPNMLYLFFTSNPSATFSNPFSGSLKAVVPLVFCQLGDLRRYYSDFPRNGYCNSVRDPSLWAERITEVILSVIVAYIPHFFST
ncbi:hypothetical protein E2C01_060225 [Portunus trituberculatus]|uniref:Uncharacterized protein n=1 Tax=Portunus trituberculatus TaxID=210409 RepID=A0A5B7H4N3_PORTR|nr:hypothetical protein [Portunus trituberculatus]